MSVLVVHGTGATTELCQKARLSPPSTATARLEAREEDFVLSSSFTAATVARESSVQQQDPPPDGGVKAWTQAAMGWLVIFTTWGYINSFGAFQTYYNEVMSESHATISWIGSIQAFLTFFVGSFSGQLMDSGYFLSTMTVGAILQLLGIFLMGASTRYGALMATQGVLTGVGNGLLFTPTLSLLATYFERRRGLALGIVTTGNSIGGMVYPVVVRQLLPSVGFAWTSRVLGFINLACLASVLVFMRPRLAPRKTGPMLDFTAYKEPVYLACVAGLFFSQWAVFYTFYSIASYGTEVLGISYADASLLVTIINGAGLPARALLPVFVDRLGPLNMMAPLALTISVISFCWLAATTSAGIYAFSVLYGLATGAFLALMPTTLASITHRLDMVGTRIGTAFTIISVAALTGPPIGGQLQSTGGGRFTWAQTWSAMAFVACTASLLTARLLHVGWNLKKRA